ncbi:MAG: hypothetical protein CL521_03645 [Actinobacteria bacterium]|nr:hypothetical protein [Actinomycetota bacterium]
MDSLTQLLMGAAMGQLVLGKKEKGKGTLIGSFAGTLPDLDVIPLMNSSVITQLSHHRGISHSLLFSVTAPFLLAWLCQRFIKWNISFQRWLIFWILAFITHIFLDLMTTWGTQILWPNPTRFSLDALFIIDPLLSIPLLIGCIMTWKSKNTAPIQWGLIITSTYMLFAIIAQQYMTHQFQRKLDEQAIPIIQKIVRPTPFNTLFWAVTARTDQDELIMAYARLWDPIKHIQLSSPIPQNSIALQPILNRADVQQLIQINKGLYVIAKDQDHIIIQDARFGRLGGWDPSSQHRFVFNYYFNTQTQTWHQSRPEMPDAGKLLKGLWNKVFK